MDIGKKIKQLRNEKSLTQETVAAALSVSPQAVSKWENGITLPDIVLLPALSTYFGVSLDELFDLSDETRLERIQNMLWDERILPQNTVRTETAFLLEHAKAHPEDPKAYTLLAQMENHLAKTHHQQAADYARQAILRNPEEKTAHSELVEAEGGRHADWYYATHHHLINWYQEFVKQHPTYRSGYMWLIDQLMDDYRFEEASCYLDQMAQIDTTFRTPLYRGKIAWMAGKQEEAFVIWDRMCEEFGQDWLTWLCMGDNLARAGRFEEAKRYYKKALEIQPVPKYVDALESIAQICEREEKNEEAIQALEEELVILKEQWDTTIGETADKIHREIARLKKLL